MTYDLTVLTCARGRQTRTIHQMIQACDQYYMLSCFSHVWLFPIPWTVACQAPLSMGFSQARILEWVAISFSRGSSWPRDWTHVSCLGSGFFTSEPPGKPLNIYTHILTSVVLDPAVYIEGCCISYHRACSSVLCFPIYPSVLWWWEIQLPLLLLFFKIN